MWQWDDVPFEYQPPTDVMHGYDQDDGDARDGSS